MQVSFGSTKIRDLEDTFQIENGETSKRRKSSGTAHIFVVTGLPSLEARIAYIDWENGDREVRGLPRSSPSIVLSRLAKGTRISISSHQGNLEWMELRLSRITQRHPKVAWSNPKQASIDDVNKACAFDVGQTLTAIGAVDLGTREDVIETTNRRRNELCVTFTRDDRIVPLAAFTAVRVLPLYLQGGGAKG